MSQSPVQPTPPESAESPAQATTPACTNTIADVQHIVILMQENRSFDHYYGSMWGVRGWDDQSVIFTAGTNSVFQQQWGSPREGNTQYPWRDGQATYIEVQCAGELPHSWADQPSAWNHGRMDGWAAAKDSWRTMAYFNRSDLAFYYGLAGAYTICDGYHGAGITATGPTAKAGTTSRSRARTSCATGPGARAATSNSVATPRPGVLL